MSKAKKLMLSLALVAALTSAFFASSKPVVAQNDAVDSQASNVLKHIPENSYGFVAANNLKDLSESIEVFASQVGLDPLLKGGAPDGVLPAIIAGLKLNESADLNGGFAVVMCNLEECGINLDGIFDGKDEGTEPPVAILVPCKKLEDTFNSVVKDNGTTNVALSGEVFMAKRVGDYAVISKSKKALELFGKGKSYADVACKQALKFHQSCSVASNVNIKALLPLKDAAKRDFEKKLREAQQKVDNGDRWAKFEVSQIKNQLEMLKSLDFAAQLTEVDFGLKFGKAGLYLDTFAAAVEGSEIAKCVASMKPLKGALFSALPNTPYVFATHTGKTKYDFSSYLKLQLDQFKNMAAAFGENGPKVSDKNIAAVIKACKDMLDQMKESQVVIGGSTDAAFGYGAEIVVENADKFKIAFASFVKNYAELINEISDGQAGITVKHEKNALTIGASNVDKITVEIAEMANMPEEAREKMREFLGDDELAVYIAKTGNNRLVVTFAGGESFRKAMVNASLKGGDLAKDKGVLKSLANLPGKKVFAGVFSIRNLYNVVANAAAASGTPLDIILPIQPNLKVKTPIASAVFVEKNTAVMRIFIPNELIKELYMETIRIKSKMEEKDGAGMAPEEDF